MFDEVVFFGVSMGWFRLCFLEGTFADDEVGGANRFSPKPEIYGLRSLSSRIFDDLMFPWMYFLGLHS